jgi:hypothetical protein
MQSPAIPLVQLFVDQRLLDGSTTMKAPVQNLWSRDRVAAMTNIVIHISKPPLPIAATTAKPEKF